VPAKGKPLSPRGFQGSATHRLSVPAAIKPLQTVADAQPQRYDLGGHHTTATMTFDEAYADAWDETDDVPEAEDSGFGSDLEPRCWLDRHPSLSAADRNPSLR